MPFKLLQTWSGVTRWLLAAVLLAWLLLGLFWGALHWLIVPRIDEFRPQLEAQATRTLGVPVRIGAISAQSGGLVPAFELTGVTLLDAQDRVALSLPRVLVAISPRSLWRLGFEQVYLDAPKLDVRRLQDGRITVAGLDLAAGPGSDTALLDWFFSQIEFVIRDGVLRWTDEQRGLEPMVLQKVAVVVRNLGRHHDMRLDATPPPQWGVDFSLRARLLQPFLARHNGRWQDWDGQLYAAFDRVDLSELRRYVDLGVNIHQGQGALRAWVDISHGAVTAATADLALTQANVTLGSDLPTLALRQLQGRVGARVLAGGFEVSTQDLTFVTPDGLRWPGGNVRLLYMGPEGKIAARGELQADQLDLAALAQLVQRLPLEAELRQRVQRHAPKGQVQNLALNWQGSANALHSYRAKGRISGLELTALAPLPGVRGLNAEFEFDQQAGRANLRVDHGSVDVLGWLQESVIDVTQFSALARWQLKGQHIGLELSDVNFANADAQGAAHIKWETSEVSKTGGHSRFPGVLDLQANLSRAEGSRVYRYLPLVIDARARDYVREAVKAGTASNVRFAIKGDISKMPQIDPRQGSFRISADVRQAALAFVPRTLQSAQELAWPSLSELSGQLLIDRMQLHVKDASARWAEGPALQVNKVEVQIADLSRAEVRISGDIRGALPDALRLVNGSPLAALTGNVLAHAVSTGMTDIKLKLALPLAHLEQSTVQGSVLLAGNDVQITPESPKLSRARGGLNFSHSGFSLQGVQALMLGGEVRLDGGLVLAPGADAARGAANVIRAVGTASAEGLRQAAELGFAARLARQATGSAAYSATLGFRRGVAELSVQSNLQGVALNLPIPLNKSAAGVLPLQLQTEVLPPAPDGTSAASALHQRLSLSLGQIGRVLYEQDLSGAAPRVLRGAIAVGLDSTETVPLPASGVSANIKLAQFNVDAWDDALAQTSVEAQTGGPSGAALAYLPTTLAVRADVLTYGGRQFNQVVIGGGREGRLWRANLDAQELNGYLEYRQGADGTASGGAGRVYARLARLTIAPAQVEEVEALLEAQPTSIPALDIVVDDFELRGKHLGRLEVQAVNRSPAGQAGGGAREWQLNQFNLSLPEASFSASGNWARLKLPAAAASSAGAPQPERRHTALNFKLDIADGGALLARLGMKDVVRQASGKIEGQVGWTGSPLKLDYPSLVGAFSVNVAAGQFLKADPGLAKLLGVLSLQSLPRRLTLDFRDVFSDGFAFDFLRGDVSIEHGIARTSNLQMKGVNAVVLMEGQADIARETQDLTALVVPEINAGTASLLASVVNPAVGLGTFFAQMFLRAPLIESNTQQFHVTGSWTDPQVVKVSRTPFAAPASTPDKEHSQ